MFPAPTTAQVNYTQVSPVEYDVHVKTDTPFWLVFSESYHPLWRAYIQDQEISSTVAYSFLNGFPINSTGEFDVKIVFRGHDYVTIGGTISAIAWVVVLLYLAYPRIKRWKITMM